MAQSTLKLFLMSSKFLLTFYILFWTNAGLAQSKNETPFEPHMLIHTIKGCPANSMCNEEMGKKKQEWLSLVKQVRDKKLGMTALEEFRKKQGQPFNVWLTGDLQPKDDINTPSSDLGKLKFIEKGPLAYWDSPCEFHRKQERPIHPAQIFIKDLTTKNLNQDMIQFQKAYLFEQNPEKSPTAFVVPRDEFPLYITPQKLVFVMEEESLFYHLSVDHAGALHLKEASNKISPPATDSVVCPDYVLRFLAQASNQEKTIYQVAQCRQYTHLGHQYILLMPTGCF